MYNTIKYSWHKCCICGEKYFGIGQSARPLTGKYSSRCCDKCYEERVKPILESYNATVIGDSHHARCCVRNINDVKKALDCKDVGRFKVGDKTYYFDIDALDKDLPLNREITKLLRKQGYRDGEDKTCFNGIMFGDVVELDEGITIREINEN